MRIAPLIAMLVVTVTAMAQQGDSARSLVIATREVPPFAMQDSAGLWHGITIELWEEIASRIGVEGRYVPMHLDSMIEAVADGRVDVAAAALTITGDRERRFDFSHPYFNTGLGIAVRKGEGGGWTRVLQRLVSLEFLQVLLVLFALLLFVGLLTWLLERRRNPEQFGGRAIEGIASGFWWSAVTMTTVGYGDKAPVTFWGRFVGLLWMFTAIIILSGITAAITSALTVSELESDIRGPEDLPRVRVVTVGASSSERFLLRRGITPRRVDDIAAAIDAVAAGKADAVVYDAPLLRYLAGRRPDGDVAVLEGTFDEQYYGFAMSEGSELREPVNRELLKILHEGTWKEIRQRYLGTEE